VTDSKYIVFKREDWNKLSGEQFAGDLELDFAIPDAVVIRKQDIFAGSALHAYASSIQTAIEIIHLIGEDLIDGRDRQSLDELRDYFFQQALEADDFRTKKVPD
jgi:hypothetical protein